MKMDDLGGGVYSAGHRYAWQKCKADARFYVVFPVMPNYLSYPVLLAVVDDYGSLKVVPK